MYLLLALLIPSALGNGMMGQYESRQYQSGPSSYSSSGSSSYNIDGPVRYTYREYEGALTGDQFNMDHPPANAIREVSGTDLGSMSSSSGFRSSEYSSSSSSGGVGRVPIRSEHIKTTVYTSPQLVSEGGSSMSGMSFGTIIPSGSNSETRVYTSRSRSMEPVGSSSTRTEYVAGMIPVGTTRTEYIPGMVPAGSSVRTVYTSGSEPEYADRLPSGSNVRTSVYTTESRGGFGSGTDFMMPSVSNVRTRTYTSESGSMGGMVPSGSNVVTRTYTSESGGMGGMVPSGSNVRTRVYTSESGGMGGGVGGGMSDTAFALQSASRQSQVEEGQIILTAHGMGMNDANRVVINVHDGHIPPLPCVMAKGGTHDHGSTFTKDNFHYQCNNGTAEVVACIADDSSVIQLGRTFLRNGIKHKCNVNGETVTYEQESMCFENGMNYNIGDSFRNGSFKLVCKDDGISIAGCFMQNSVDILMVGESRIEGRQRHECEDLGNGKIRYTVKVIGCQRHGETYNIGQVWTDKHVRYRCTEEGTLDVLGCIDEGLFLDLGRDILMNGMAHRCYQVGTTTFYHKLPCDGNLYDCIASSNAITANRFRSAAVVLA